MAWDGTVRRRITAVKPRPEGGSTILFECQHERLSNRPAETILKWFREYPCEACSAPHRQRIAEIRAGISFDDVLVKVKELYRERTD